MISTADENGCHTMIAQRIYNQYWRTRCDEIKKAPATAGICKRVDCLRPFYFVRPFSLHMIKIDWIGEMRAEAQRGRSEGAAHQLNADIPN